MNKDALNTPLTLQDKLKTLTDMLFNYITLVAFDEAQYATNPRWDVEIIGRSPITNDLFLRAIAPVETDKGLSVICSEVLTLASDEFEEILKIMKRLTANPNEIKRLAENNVPILPPHWATFFNDQIDSVLLQDQNFFEYAEADQKELTTKVFTLRGVIHG